MMMTLNRSETLNTISKENVFAVYDRRCTLCDSCHVIPIYTLLQLVVEGCHRLNTRFSDLTHYQNGGGVCVGMCIVMIT